jgi:hypothetical protein
MLFVQVFANAPPVKTAAAKAAIKSFFISKPPKKKLN